MREPRYLLDDRTTSDDPNVGITEVDYEEQTAGYQAAYSRLAASETVAVDPVAYVGEPRAYVEVQLRRASENDSRVRALMAAGDQEYVVSR